MSSPKYNHEAADRWEDAVLTRFRGRLVKSDVRFLLALRRMERLHGAFCQPIVKNQQQWKKDTGISPNTLAQSEGHCAELGLIDYVPGIALETDKVASQIRRRTLVEIETGINDSTLESFVPAPAAGLVERLKGRKFSYGGEIICPRYKAGKTGRIAMSHPGLQTQPDKLRTERVMTGLTLGDFLIEADYSQAEPMVARHLLDQHGLLSAKEWPDDIYHCLATALGQSRDEAKSIFNAFLRSASSLAKARAWALPPNHFLVHLAKALDVLKDRLWQESKPASGERRKIYSLGRTRVQATKGEKAMHRGRILSWVLTATVADCVHPVVNDILDREQAGDWRFMFMVYDAVYVVTSNLNDAPVIRALMQDSAQKLGLALGVTVQIHKGPEKKGPGRNEEKNG